MKIAYFWLTSQGELLAEKLQSKLGGIIEPKENFSETVKRDFYCFDALVFITATGIAVRMIAPLLEKKTKDPAIVVLDHKGQYAISLLSGHIGGANRLTHQIASLIGAIPVITTATDTEGVIAFDEVAKYNKLAIENIDVLKHISGALLEGNQVEVISDIEIEDKSNNPQIILTNISQSKYRVIISDKQTEITDKSYTLYLRPKSLVVGIGCKRNTECEHLEECFEEFLKTYGYSKQSVSKIATIKIKENENAIQNLCDKYGYSLEIVSDKEILECDYPFEKSEFVESITGLPSVAEACSYIASDCGEVLTGKVKYSGVTLAVCRKKMSPITLNIG